MKLNQSSSVRVSLVYRPDTEITPTIEIAGNAGIIATPIPVGTPGVPLPKALGPKYKALITARLVGSAFDIEPLNNEPYTLSDQESVTWDWSVTPRQAGKRELLLVVEIKWIPQDGGQSITYQVGRQRLEVKVDKPVFVIGDPIGLTSILTAIGGALLAMLSKKIWPLIAVCLKEPSVDDRELEQKARDSINEGDGREAMQYIAQIEDDSLRELLWRIANATMKKETKEALADKETPDIGHRT